MADHKPLYRWSLQDAIAHNEVQDWRDSYRENCDCARSIERAIADHLMLPAAATLCYGFLTIRMDDTTILDFIRYAGRYFITTQQYYEWR